MTLLYVLRHPETTWNVEKRYQGRLESPLSDEGRLQAKAVAVGFQAVEIDAIYSSPLGRARYLAEQIARVTEVPIVVDERFTEMAQCPWEGLYLAEIQRRFPDLYERWYARPDSVTFPGGENLGDICSRVFSALNDLVRKYPNESVAITTHSVVIQTLVATVLGLDLRHLHRIRVDNATVTSLAVHADAFKLLALNASEPYRPAAGGSQGAEWVKERRAS